MDTWTFWDGKSASTLKDVAANCNAARAAAVKLYAGQKFVYVDTGTKGYWILPVTGGWSLASSDWGYRPQPEIFATEEACIAWCKEQTWYSYHVRCVF